MSRPAPARQVNPVGESGEQAAPEGATAPETLREPDRGGMNTLESARLASRAADGVSGRAP